MDREALNFEQVISRLQEIVRILEQGNLPLEECIKVFEEGIRLSKLGSKILDEAEKKVEILLDQGKTKELSLDSLSNKEE
jgi:exodeoxyribonuclease VII small subunit